MSNQSCGNLEQQQAARLGNEMRAVQSTYTACIRDQELPPSAQDVYRLVADLATKAVSGSDEHPGVSIDAVNAVRCIDRYIRETTSELNTARRDLAKRTEDTRLYRFHVHFADYAGFVCNVLKESESGSHSLLSRPWTQIVHAIDREQEALDTWKASDRNRKTRPVSPYMVAIRDRVKALVDRGWNGLDVGQALFAIRFYARRNFICHGEIFDLFTSKNFAGLAEYIDADVKILEDVLPDEEKPMVDKYRALLTLYKDMHIRKNDQDEWVEQAPLQRSLGASSRPLGPALISAIELGKFRPPGSSGPPPGNVSFDPATLRRQSEPKGTKRPAVDQPPGQPPVKVARGLNYSSEWRPKKPVPDADSLGAQKLQERLHILGAELAQRKPAKALIVFEMQIAQLEKELESLSAAAYKKQRKAEQPSLPHRK